MSIRTLRLIGLMGLAVVLFVDLIASLRMKSGLVLGFAMLVVFPLVVGVASFLLMPRAVGALARWPDFLVPLALVTVVIRVVEWLAMLPVLGLLLNPKIALNIFNASVAVPLRVVLTIIVGVFYASWITGVVNEQVGTGRGDLCAARRPAWQRFWRVLGAEIIGGGGLMLITTLLIGMLPYLGLFMLLPLAVFAVGWNFSTAALLPVVCQSDGGFWQSIKLGFLTSLAQLRKWWLLLLVQMILLGLVFISFQFRAGSKKFNWSVEAFWTGSYEAGSRWYGKLAAAYEVAQLPIVQTLLALLFGALAIAIKIAIVQRLQEAKPTTS